MSYSILQSFLDNQFIKTDETSHIDSLKKASSAVQKLLGQKKNKPKIIQYTLVALDPTISDDNPVIEEVEEIIIKQWSTFRNSVVKTKDAPIAYVQAVILDALDKLSKDINMAAIIWHTGCNVVSYYKLAGQEEVLTDFLLRIGTNVEKAARDSWALLENLQIDAIEPIEFSLPKINHGRISKGELEGHLMAAAAQVGAGGENPQWPSHNAAQWPTFFSERAAEGLSEEINAALSTQNTSITSISNSIQESVGSYLASLKPYLEQVSSSIMQGSQSLNKRSDLLWWKQSLYSTRLESGYRTLGSLPMAVAMAVDLADNVFPIYPKSVDYFLEETLRDVLGDGVDKKITLEELLVQLQQLSDAEKRLFDGLHGGNTSRESFGACMARALNEEIISDEFSNHTGIERSTEISLGRLAIWLFHDIHANELANVK